MGGLLAGETVAERFVVKGRLAAGGMAEIYVADAMLPKGLTRRVAIKRVHSHLADDPEFTTMFLDEVRISSQLVHPGIIPVLDAIDSAGELMLVLEYVPGWDLAAVLRAKGTLLPIESVAHIGRSLAATLAAVHGALDATGKPLEIVHRDVSPSNVLVAEDGTIRLLDFGVAKAASRATRSATRSLKGKLAYLAPEQVKGESIDARTDLYALGLTLFEALTGVRALSGADDISMLERARAPKHVSAASIRDDIPAEMNALVSQLLSADPSARPADGAEVDTALAPFDSKGRGRQALREAVAARLGSGSRPIAEGAPDIDVALARAIAGSGPVTLMETAKETPPTTPANDESPAEAGVVDPRTSRAAKPPRRASWTVAALALVASLVGVAAWAYPRPDPSVEDPTFPEVAPVADGFIRAVTEPPGARVFVSGELEDETTPTVVSIPGGTAASVRLELDDYVPVERQVRVEPGVTSDVTLTLERVPGRIVVNTAPTGATVELDGELVGVTPWESADIERRAHDLDLRLDGYAPHTAMLDLSVQHEANVQHTFVARRATGLLDVQSTPWGVVYVDGRRVAESTPVLGLRLSAGEHVVRIRNPRQDVGGTWPVSIGDGERERLVVQLR